jgi:glycosyltransferase involved in cell wall biosynthesis
VDLRLKDAGYKLVMVGGKDLQYKEFFDYYESLDKETKKCVLFLQVPFNHLVALYRNASLFVFPSKAEGFGIPPIEAIAYGCPILCSNATAMAEFNFPDDISFDPNDFENLKNKIIKQLDSPMNPLQYKDSILSFYNWQKIADAYYAVLVDNMKGFK